MRDTQRSAFWKRSVSQVHVGLVAVRIGGAGERVYDSHGRVDPHYRPDVAGVGAASHLASLLGGRLYGDHDLNAAAARAAGILGKGPTRPLLNTDRRLALGRFLVLVGALPLAFLLARRYTGLSLPRVQHAPASSR